MKNKYGLATGILLFMAIAAGCSAKEPEEEYGKYDGDTFIASKVIIEVYE